ncbi:MAG: class I SAM-dependent methyltransferase [Candidatus Scalinduaceae bacterium]
MKTIEKIGLIYYLSKKRFLKKGIKVLDIAPSMACKRYFERRDIDYISINIQRPLNPQSIKTQMDLTMLGFKNEKFDLVIISHVLDYIKKDIQALKESYRVLKKSGKCLILIPFYGDRIITEELNKIIIFQYVIYVFT